MPLKHHTETAYLIVLGLLICVSAFLTSLLPELPEGLRYCVLFFTVAALYPIFLIPTFRRNRADYEFRLLHWLPAGSFALWLLLQIIDPYWRWFHITNLGFLFLWSVPIVALGLGSAILFCIHVIRRKTVRIAVLSSFFVLFTVGALLAESKGWNPRLQHVIFRTGPAIVLRPAMERMGSLLRTVRMSEPASDLVSKNTVSSVRSSVRIKAKSSAISSSDRSSVMMDRKPNRLPQSGPESLLVLAATLLALYAGTLHARQRYEA